MPPKAKRTKAEEAAAFLSTLDDFDVPATTPPPPGPAEPSSATASSPAPADSKRSFKTGVDASIAPPSKSGSPAPAASAEQDEEAANALAFLEEQIKTKRAPLSVPGPGSLRGGPGGLASTSSPLSGPKASVTPEPPAPNEPSSSMSAQAGGGWGSWWSTAATAVQTAQKIADEGYKKVRAEGVQGLEGVKVAGVDLGSLKKGAEERLKGIQAMQIQGLDLDKLRQDLLHNTQSALSTLMNTVAPPISEHETLELWLSHPLVGYAGVEGVVYRAWMRILEQTESGELVVVWSAPDSAEGLEERGMYPVDGWQAGWEVAQKEIGAVRAREEKNPVGRGKENPSVPVTTVPIFLHLQPVLAPLPFAEPSLLLPSSTETEPTSSKQPNHLYFIVSLHDPTHSIRFTTTTQPSPADWLEVEYERSDWVEERLVDVLRTGVEIVAQDYVATRMGLKAKGGTTTPPGADSAPVTAFSLPSGQEDKKE
ncbi:uncharacterized protein MKK02DRAFT_25746 [Dioszegia hungarica]|uniref:Maintenance of telomere capping protein 1 n=1 Tax=Dioszegia hungarica TaxID=4972 RepID=A0AA38LV19_9TREE|nr:uncharacterized protein MKK02DRAFT_25746 [Dioszegia hungarica]KAI9636675.1 hypothetical protein MKK02DRAFT_25746 [Dioszegia hungarica]